MGPEADGLSSDWVFSVNSDHICNDKRWFKTFVPFPTCVKQRGIQLSDDIVDRAEGVGTVELPVKRSPHLQGRYAHDELRLQNVLYVPGFLFNVVGGGILTMYGWRYDSRTPYKNQDSCIVGGRGLQVCYMRHISGLPCIRLSGPPNGPVIAPSRLEADTVYGVKDVRWPEEERGRFEILRAKSASGQTPKSRTQPKVSIESVAADEHSDKPYYTSEEKAWLKKYYGNEFKFLRTYGLSIYKEDQRAEGRHLARSMMSPDEEEDVLPELIDSEPAAETPSAPPEDKKKKKNHNAKVHQQVIDAGLVANAAKISSVDVNRNVKVSSNVVPVEPEKVERDIQNIEPGKKEGKNKKKDENTSGGIKINVGSGVNNSKSINGNAELNVVDGSQVKIGRVQALPKLARIGKEKENSERKSELELANDDTTGGGGGGAPLSTSKNNAGNDTNVARNVTAPQIQSTQHHPPTNAQPGNKNSNNNKKGKGKYKAPAKVLTPEEEEAAAQMYLQSLLQNVAIKNDQDRQRAEAAPARTADISQPAVADKQKGNGKRTTKEIKENDDLPYYDRPYPFAAGGIFLGHNWM